MQQSMTGECIHRLGISRTRIHTHALAYTHTRTHTHTHTRTFTHTHTHITHITHACTRTHTYKHTHTHTYTRTRTSTYTHTHQCTLHTCTYCASSHATSHTFSSVPTSLVQVVSFSRHGSRRACHRKGAQHANQQHVTRPSDVRKRSRHTLTCAQRIEHAQTCVRAPFDPAAAWFQ